MSSLPTRLRVEINQERFAHEIVRIAVYIENIQQVMWRRRPTKCRLASYTSMCLVVATLPLKYAFHFDISEYEFHVTLLTQIKIIIIVKFYDCLLLYIQYIIWIEWLVSDFIFILSISFSFYYTNIYWYDYGIQNNIWVGICSFSCILLLSCDEKLL